MQKWRSFAKILILQDGYSINTVRTSDAGKNLNWTDVMDLMVDKKEPGKIFFKYSRFDLRYDCIEPKRLESKVDDIEVTSLNSDLQKITKKSMISLVILYIPNPVRCFKCQRFGHMSSVCHNEAVCICGRPDHLPDPCVRPFTCVNCNENHLTNSKLCPRMKQEVAIQNIKVSERSTYNDAKRKYMASLPSNITYAEATFRPQNPTIALQECMPSLVKLIEDHVEKAVIAALKQGRNGNAMPPPASAPTSSRQQNIPDYDNISTVSDTMSQISEKRKRTTYAPRTIDTCDLSEDSSTSQLEERSPARKKKGWQRGRPRKPQATASDPDGNWNIEQLQYIVERLPRPYIIMGTSPEWTLLVHSAGPKPRKRGRVSLNVLNKLFKVFKIVSVTRNGLEDEARLRIDGAFNTHNMPFIQPLGLVEFNTRMYAKPKHRTCYSLSGKIRFKELTSLLNKRNKVMNITFIMKKLLSGYSN
nr:unnamed protein product [Callosobruchus chinensis]